eukprot:scaffold24470_cov129-Isochrysis_galbana.AAC.2
MWFLVGAPPHDDPPSLAGDRGIQFLGISTKTNKHTPQARGEATRQGRHKGAGKGTYTSCSEGCGPLRVGLPTPLSGA